MSDEMDEIWELYADDGTQALDAMEVAIEALMAADGAPDPHVAALFRAVHTFKGNSRVLGLAVVESRAHLAEDLIGLVRDEGAALTAEILDCLMETGDHLRRMLDETARTRADVQAGPSEGLAETLRALIARIKGGDGAAPQTPAVPSAEAEPPQDVAPALVVPAAEETGGAGSDAAPSPAADLDTPAEPAPKPARPRRSGVKTKAKPADATPDASSSAPQDPAANGDAAAVAALSLDPGYAAIFLDMVDTTLADLDALRDGDLALAVRKADGLGYAAGQLGLGIWVEALAPATRDGFTSDALGVMIDRLHGLRALQFGTAADPVDAQAATAPEAASDDAPAETLPLFARLEPLFSRVADLSLQLGPDQRPDPEVLTALADEIDGIATSLGYVRVALAGRAFASARDLDQIRRAQLDFYEELATVERSLSKDLAETAAIRPTAILRSWSADHIFDILQDLRMGLEAGGRATGAAWFPSFEPLMRRAFHACAHFQMETAAQLTMALVDLFSRVRLDGKTPDVILVQIARGFVDTMELVFDTLDQGDTPDIARIEQLFEEAATVSFLASGVVTARVIEERLGLPEEFHRVLSPESVKSAQSALDAGLRFYVIRADLNGDDTLAEAFLQWLSSDKIRMITNVTVFQGDITLFDFLVAAPLSEDRVVEALAHLDAAGARLDMRYALQTAAEPEVAAETAENAVLPGPSGLDSLRFLETIGEMSAGQSMVAAMLDEVATVDLAQELQTALRHAGLPQPDPALRGVLRDLFEGHLGRLRQINEAQTQLNTQLAALQEQSVALRSRPADVLLKPLQTYVSTKARAAGLSARLSIGGGEVMLDQSMIEQLREVLKRLLGIRLGATPAPRKLHVAVSRFEDQLRVEMSDDGDPDGGALDVAAVARDLQRHRGSLRRVLPPDGGLRLHLAIPLHMIALEGMVVRVGDVHYVLPIETIQRIHQGSALMAIAASGQRRMLKLTETELVPIRPLPRAATGPAPTSDNSLFVIVHTAETTRLAIPVDELLGQQLVLLRPLQGVLGGLRDMSGVAILSGGQVGVVVSVSRLAQAA